MLEYNQMKSYLALGLVVLLCACATVNHDQGAVAESAEPPAVKPRILTAGDLAGKGKNGMAAKTFVVREYRFEANGEGGDPAIGLSLCGPRCTGLAGDLANILKPGGWRLVKVAENVQVRVDLDNPFMKGRCLCIGDEFNVDWFDPAVGGCEMGGVTNEK